MAKLNPEDIPELIRTAQRRYDVSSSIPHDSKNHEEIMTWQLDSIACSLMAIARILAYKEGHGDE